MELWRRSEYQRCPGAGAVIGRAMAGGAETVGVLSPRPPRTPEVVILYVGCRQDQELEGAKEHKVYTGSGH
jgi:hypothetical protein